MDEKEDGQISLEDVSSSDEGQSGCAIPWIDSATSSAKRNHALGGHGKENRRYSSKTTCCFSSFPSKADTFHEVSSNDEREIVGLPDSSRHLYIHLGKKKRKRRRKKKSGGVIAIEDFVSVTESEPLLLNAPVPRTEIVVHRRRRSRSPRLTRRHSPSTKSHTISRSPSKSPPRFCRATLRSSPSPEQQCRTFSSPPPQQRSPRRLRLSRCRSPRNVPPTQRDNCSKKSSITSGREKPLRKNLYRRSRPGYADPYASSLLKKLRHLETVGTSTPDRKHKDSSLKDKLSNILNTKPNTNPVIKQTKEIKSEESEEGGEEDVNVLRRLALETKQKTNKICVEPDHLSDNDPEDLELRMIALKSAVLKKHEERVKNKKGKYNVTESALPGGYGSGSEDQYPSVSDMLPGIQRPQDMELDTDVEEEKQSNSPYSPRSPIDEDIRHSAGSECLAVSSNLYITNGEQKDMEAPYSPTDPTNTPMVDIFKKAKRKTILNMITFKGDSASSDEAPYSPSDTPTYDSEYPSFPSDALAPHDYRGLCNIALDLSIKECQKSSTKSLNITTNEKISGTSTSNTLSKAVVDLPNITVDTPINKQNQILQIDRQVDQELACSNISASSTLLLEKMVGIIEEPLYLRGLPEIRKEPNKIPIPVNKSLLPVSILKCNKNLQQPLPPKKIEILNESVFKSAHMQPVKVDRQPVFSTTTFKPIKLQPVIKKSTVSAHPALFNNVLMNTSKFVVSKDVSNIEDYTDHHLSNTTSEKTAETRYESENIGDSFNSSSLLSQMCKKEHSKKCEKKCTELRMEAWLETANAMTCNSALDSNILHHDVQALDISNNSGQISKPSTLAKSNDKLEPGNENCKIHGKENLSMISIATSKIGQRTNIEQQKDESNVQLAAIRTSNEKKRRNSLEEDEETLRAILIASMAKRPKAEDDTDIKASNYAGRPLQESLKVQNIVRIPNQENNIIVNVKKAESELKSFRMANKPSQINAALPVNIWRSKPMNQHTASTPVQRFPGTVPEVAKKDWDGVCSVESRKRVIPCLTKGASKKLIKKVAFPISTKVVNNAKKFQNTLMHKKLILQTQEKALTSIERVRQNLPSSNLKDTEAARPVSPMMKSSENVQRLVINLGEDSESDSDYDFQRNKFVGTDRTTLTIPTTDFEKSVDQFLKDQRKKQETMALSSVPINSTPTSTHNEREQDIQMVPAFIGTPLAVRHLSLSQQAEYKRLKQQILEKERQRANRQMNTILSPHSSSDPISKSTKSGSSTILPAGTSFTSSRNSGNPRESTLQITTKPLRSESTLQKSTQPRSIPETEVHKRFISSSTLLPSQPMNHVSVHIPNNTLTLPDAMGLQKSLNSNQKAREASSALRILKTDQLNSNLVQVQLQLGTRIVVVGRDNALSDHDMSMEELLQCKDIDINCAKFNNNMNSERNMGIDEESSSNGIEFPIKSSQSSLVDTGSIMAGPVASTPTIFSGNADNPVQKESTEVSTICRDSIISQNTTIVDSCIIAHEKAPVKVKKKYPAKENAERIKLDVKSELESLSLLSEDNQRNRLTEIEGNLVIKRYSVLDDLTDMTSRLKQWDQERELQTNLFAEVKHLRAQLAIAENRLLGQRVKIDSIGPIVTKAHRTILDGRAECLKLTKLCQSIGNKVIGQQYKVPVTGAQLMMERLKEVAYHTRQLSKKKVPCENDEVESVSSVRRQSMERTMRIDSEANFEDRNNGNSDNTISELGQSDNTIAVFIDRLPEKTHNTLTQRGTCPASGSMGMPGQNSKPAPKISASAHKSKESLSHFANSYQSVLRTVKTPRHIDLHRELCPFELTGICKDYNCLYNHLEPRNLL